MIAPKVTGARRVFAKVALHCLDIHKSATDLTSLLEQSGWGSTRRSPLPSNSGSQTSEPPVCRRVAVEHAGDPGGPEVWSSTVAFGRACVDRVDPVENPDLADDG